MCMGTIAVERHKRRSSLTVYTATAKSRVVLTQIEDGIPDPSEFRVGSFHVPSGRASADPTLGSSNGAAS